MDFRRTRLFTITPPATGPTTARGLRWLAAGLLAGALAACASVPPPTVQRNGVPPVAPTPAEQAGAAAREQGRPVVQDEFQHGPVQAPAAGSNHEQDPAEPGFARFRGDNSNAGHSHAPRREMIRRSSLATGSITENA